MLAVGTVLVYYRPFVHPAYHPSDLCRILRVGGLYHRNDRHRLSNLGVVVSDPRDFCCAGVSWDSPRLGAHSSLHSLPPASETVFDGRLYVGHSPDLESLDG